MKKEFIFTLIALGLVLFLYSMNMYHKTPESISTLKTEFEVNATELLTAFEENETLANHKFLDKVIAVKGVVDKKEFKDGVLTAYLKTNNPLSKVIFQFENQNENIQEGEHLTLKGICTGYLMDVVLVRAKKV